MPENSDMDPKLPKKENLCTIAYAFLVRGVQRGGRGIKEWTKITFHFTLSRVANFTAFLYCTFYLWSPSLFYDLFIIFLRHFEPKGSCVLSLFHAILSSAALIKGKETN